MGAEGRTLKECGDVGRVGDLSHGVTLAGRRHQLFSI